MAPDRGPTDRAVRRRGHRRSRGARRAQGCPSTRDAAGRANRVGRRMTLSHSHRRSSMMARSLAILLLASIVLSGATPAVAQAPAGQMTWAVHVSLAPTWFDPAEHTGIITLMMVLYAVHDALVKPMPGNPLAPSLAESWSMSKDGLSYEFVLRKGVVFHNGDPFTAEDVKFSFDRYKGAAAKLLKDKVAAVDDKDGINQAETLGFSKPSGSIIPSAFEFALAISAYPYDPARAKKLLAEAGYPNGFDGGEFACDASYSSVAEAIGNYLAAVGIRTKLRPIERAAFLGNWREKKITSIMYTGAGGQGNAATRIQNYYVQDGLYSWGGYPDMDDLFVQQARELDPKRREVLLHQIQRLAHERVMSAPLWELGFLNAVGPRVDESGLGLIALFPYSSPYEDLKLKK
ncbi:MAG: hypothetical protein DME04_11400 [Candidatus Rokuibacteriota bacterium]|nr:MAG: hypothetical protein DME04_11400 [Candidatus Rokubacteria bacterium]